MGIFARPNVPDMPPKRTLKIRLGIRIKVTYMTIIEGERTRGLPNSLEDQKTKGQQEFQLIF